MKDIQPAGRVSEIQEYYFSRKLREVARLNAEGRDIISLGIGGPDRMPSAEVIDTLCEEARKPGAHSYQPYVGIPELRRAMSRFYSRHYGVDLNPDTEIQPLIGSKEGILHVSLAFLNPGDGVLVPNPGYPTYTSVSRLVGAEIFNYDLTEDGGWMPDFEALERLPLDRIKLMWINYPHMPTGTPASVGLFEKIVDFGRRHGIMIAHDNPYSFILNDNPLSLLQVDGARDVAIEMNSMSKSHNMAGWRVGMLASNPQFIQWVLKVKSNIDSGQFRPLMLAAVKGLDAPDEWYAGLNETYARRRLIAERIMKALGCEFDPRQRGLFLWGRIPQGEASSETLADRVLYGSRVFITPGFIFGSNGDRYVRISLCATEEKLAEALKRIEETYKTA
ncbi:aminotransferase class I/II-fold pyridoxal phosphate-dependent enzyme [Muribaculaceae bacterium Isolate-007 (NCI)]|nr:aminotransferase class I/II-fold pyridoxal phosphate-dependent enzyme [Muribaculum intestinale]ROT02553.1 aminotransferase class I/II-fold pyridoxal phosphate-dependent enzyme [Muribaculaceae bacterium Isolate-100 (HZI)]RXE63752.1 aminotransferase class I/II-fold pyridoxal phosphate-dependent enzyme [Muribaculaceae bacterium Isolate-007 (NCI)]